MKLTHGTRALFFALCSTLLLYGQDQPKGIHPRSKPEDYAAHMQIQSHGMIIAATALSPDEVKHLFAFDISKNYVVFEVACYPEANGRLQLQADDFVVKTNDKLELAHRADSQTVAASIQQKNTPRSPSTPTIYTEANVGYESGTDPYTGRRVHGVYTGGGVGVSNYPTPQYPGPGGYPQDRELLENQLWNKSLPDGTFTAPVAGYLYFPSALLKKKTNGGYLLQYQSADLSSRMDLQVPAKTK
ncbi:MAG: hypothetical protein JO182_05225 [Acidobacteriaceae bacterium]|nr:hypothetical protein [Acidobacteriaceae bacterium]MBV9940152.1 hypothetical protein [Acidobacteriaceae bacterium]